MNDKRSTLNTNEGLISKQAVLDLFDEHVGVMSNFSKVWDAVEHLPSATIRCKDCVFFKEGTINFPNVCKLHDGLEPDHEWFCADGKR